MELVSTPAVVAGHQDYYNRPSSHPLHPHAVDYNGVDDDGPDGTNNNNTANGEHELDDQDIHSNSHGHSHDHDHQVYQDVAHDIDHHQQDQWYDEYGQPGYDDHYGMPMAQNATAYSEYPEFNDQPIQYNDNVNMRFNAEYPQDGEYPDNNAPNNMNNTNNNMNNINESNPYYNSHHEQQHYSPPQHQFMHPASPSSFSRPASTGGTAVASARRPPRSGPTANNGSPRGASTSPSPRHTLSHSQSLGYVSYPNPAHRHSTSNDFVQTPRSEHSGYASDSAYAMPHPRSLYNGHSRRPSSVSLMSDQYASASMFDLSQSYIMPLFNDDKNKQNVMPRLKTIELYRKNAKKSNDPMIQFQFAQYMLQTALRAGAKLSSAKSQLNLNNPAASMSSPSLALSNNGSNANSNGSATSSAASSSSERIRDSTSSEHQDRASSATPMSPLSANFTGGSGGNNSAGALAGIDDKIKKELLKEALSILRKLSDKGYADAQYLLGDAFASGALGRKDMKESFSLFQLAAKHGHGEAAYRTALCLEQGWGTSRDVRRSVQFLRMAASRNQPGAMLRLGMACFYGRMGLPNTSTTKLEGVKWLKLASNEANEVFPQAPYELARIIQHGYKDIVIPDVQWALQLYVRSAELRHIPAARILGRAYEHGELECPQNAGLSIHYYTIGAQGGDPECMLALCAWYTVGAKDVLPLNHEEAFEWALRAANAGYAKAQCAVGYFLERGIGCERDIFKSTQYYEMAAKAGHPSAIARLRRDRNKALDPKSKKDKDCVIC